MKYIRTKDGNLETIYELQDNGDWTKKGNLCLDKTHFRYKDLQNHIIKQADTIEELCDKWVYDNNTGENKVLKDISFASLETMKRRFANGLIKNVFLAIWTDKGLIYVAKMNNKGELELL